MHRIFILFTVLSLFSAKLCSQEIQRERAKLTLFNIGFNGLTAGLGAMINKSEGQRPGQAFLSGFSKGAIGGAFIDLGFRSSRLIATEQELWLAWPSRLITSAGASVVANGSANKAMFDQLNVNLWLFRLEYRPATRKLKTRIFTSSVYGLLNVSRNGKFDLGRSLETGSLYFVGDRFNIVGSSSFATGQVSSIGMSRELSGKEFYDVFAHEVMHLLQYERLSVFNPYLIKPDLSLQEKSKFYRGLSKYLHFDLNGPVMWITYYLQSGRPHSCRFLEQEAENFAGGVVYRCLHN